MKDPHDLVHQMWGPQDKDKHILADAFIIVNLVILLWLFIQDRVNLDLAKKAVVVWIVLLIIREVVQQSTQSLVPCDPNDEHIFGPNEGNKWYLISGHTIISYLITYVIFYSGAEESLKIVSVFCLCMAMAAQIITQQHYTCDILVGLLVTFLTSQAYLLPAGVML
jgi:hypothetical protein